jgi:hypothetical protein
MCIEVDDKPVCRRALSRGLVLPWHALVAVVEGKQEPVTTENEDT